MNFAATILFAFVSVQSARKKLVCEEKIFAFHSESEDDAFAYAQNIGMQEEHDIKGSAHQYRYTFIGITELVELSLDTALHGEIWHRYLDILDPVGRKSRLVPSKQNLTVFRRYHRKGGILE